MLLPYPGKMYPGFVRGLSACRYKIPVAPASYTSQIVETLRGAVASMPEPAGHNGPRYMGASSLNEASIRQMLQSFKCLGFGAG